MATFSLHGLPVSRGIAIGRAHLLARAAMDVQHYIVAQEQVEDEVHRLQSAIETVRNELQSMWSTLPKDSPAELGAFIDVHVLILSDPLIAETTLDIIRSRQYNAEWALVTQIDEVCAQFNDVEDAYLRERRSDIQQVGERVLKVLTGTAVTLPEAVNGDPGGQVIVVAHDISPADMLQFKDRAFGGFITDLGGPSSHTAIVARSLDIPAAVGVSKASTLVRHDDVVIIDGDAGVVIVSPTPELLEQFRERQARQMRARKKLGKLKKTPAITLDGTPITLLANIELPDDCRSALDAGAVGVGLFRSEFLFMGRASNVSPLPSEEEQFESYRRAVNAMKGRPIVIRTLDVGADKPLNVNEMSSMNPALGLRAIRYCLAEPQMFLTQLRAILRASAFGPVKIMIPLLSHAYEIDQVLLMVEQAKAQLRALGKKFDPLIPVGAMIEVPAAALALPMFIKRMDFLSIGTNDLIQYTLAIDRADHEVAHLHDPLHPAILYLLSNTIAAGEKAGVPVAVCGEMAGDVRFTRLLLGMGLREFSMHPAQILAVKQEILSSDLNEITPIVRKILRQPEPAAIETAMARLRPQLV